MNNFRQQFIEKWNKIYTAAGRFYPFRLFAGVKNEEPFIPHDFKHCKTYEDFRKEGVAFVDKHFGKGRTEFYPKSMKKFKEENPDWKPNLDIYDWDLVGDNKNDALEPTKYYTLEPNPLAERIDEKDLPKDKLYYVWMADKMLDDKFYKRVNYKEPFIDTLERKVEESTNELVEEGMFFKPYEQVKEEQQREMDIENNMNLAPKYHSEMVEENKEYYFTVGFINVPCVIFAKMIGDKSYRYVTDLKYFVTNLANKLRIPPTFEFREIPLMNAIEVISDTKHVITFDELWEITDTIKS